MSIAWSLRALTAGGVCCEEMEGETREREGEGKREGGKEGRREGGGREGERRRQGREGKWEGKREQGRMDELQATTHVVSRQGHLTFLPSAVH